MARPLRTAKPRRRSRVSVHGLAEMWAAFAPLVKACQAAQARRIKR